jgi:aspartate aminotransferase
MLRPVPPSTQDMRVFAHDPNAPSALRLSALSRGIVGSEILSIAIEIRGRQAAGEDIADLSVGDFDPRQFPIPAQLTSAIHAALERGETNYPPPDGVPQLREAVADLLARDLALSYPVESVLITSGSRPAIYGAYRTLCDPGDRVLYPVPSWNNDHYVHHVGGISVPVPCGPETGFLPTREALAPHLAGARLLVLCSPLNPAGSAFGRDALLGICEDVLAENAARARRSERTLFVLYDQVYRTLCFDGTEHLTPPGLLPEMARYTVFSDGISKAFAATGLRVGWAVGPTDVIERMVPLLSQVGTWAPRPHQAAVAAVLGDVAALDSFRKTFRDEAHARLERLEHGLLEMKAAGLPVDCLQPQGTIYLAACFALHGRRTANQRALQTNEDIRRYLLDTARVGIVPFDAFGSSAPGWFRMSVGVLSPDAIDALLERLELALRAVA